MVVVAEEVLLDLLVRLRSVNEGRLVDLRTLLVAVVAVIGGVCV